MKVKNFTKENCPSIFFHRALKIIPVIGMLLLIHLSIHAQDKGIQFEKGSTWKEVLAKAKAANKYIFMDCYTTWCGPCKYMSANIFPQEKVGSFFNKNFINVKFQIDSTAKDGEEIKKEYADAAFINKQFKIEAYPTYLFFNPNGELVHRELGSSTAPEFVTKATNALDIEKQYYTQVKKYETGNRDAGFLRNLTHMAIDAYDRPGASKYVKDFLATKPDLEDKDNLRLIYESTASTTDTGFAMMMNRTATFETAVDKKELHSSLASLIFSSESKNIAIANWDKKEWDTYSADLLKKYPGFADEVLVRLKTAVFSGKKDWVSYAEAVGKYTSSQPVSNSMLNEFAWFVFERCNDKDILGSALRWSKMTFEKEAIKEPGYIDTYANLLYKLGRKEEALTWEKKAQEIAIAQGADKSWGQDVIDKINKGEHTW